MNQYNCMDLFSGAGALSLGFANTNRFNILAHIEWEKPMVATLRNDLIKRFKISEYIVQPYHFGDSASKKTCL
nr:DNA cytosine methyltransferase [Helicobacter pylori]